MVGKIKVVYSTNGSSGVRPYLPSKTTIKWFIYELSLKGYSIVKNSIEIIKVVAPNSIPIEGYRIQGKAIFLGKNKVRDNLIYGLEPKRTVENGQFGTRELTEFEVLTHTVCEESRYLYYGD